VREGTILCRACDGERYYQVVEPARGAATATAL
jgi:hypothetical protein